MKNNKGFTLVEMLVSFTLSMVLIIILFQLIINLKDIYMLSGIKTELLNKQYLMTNKIYSDLNEKKVIKIENCNNPLVCVEFTFQDGTIKKLEVDDTNKTLSYDGYIIKLDNNSYFETMDINTTYSQSNKKIFNANIPIYNDLYKNTNFGINIVYPYNDQEITNNYGDKYVAPVDSYISLPYIKADGNQHIDTRYIPNANTKVEMDFDATVSQLWILGSRTSVNDSDSFGVFMLSDTQYWVRIGGNNDSNDYKLNVNSVRGRHKIYVTGSSFIQDNTSSIQYTSNNTTGNYSLYIGTINTAGTANSHLKGNIYNVKIYEGDTLVMNLTPAKSRKTDKIGLYDTVSKQFFISNGTSDFIYE